MNILDIPDSTIYLQKGAITQLVAQIIDINTGRPVPLQLATGMSITLLYPDQVTTAIFEAELYTDGSDGRIVYTTKNQIDQVDLSQVGLYLMQGIASIGGIQLPPSERTDFYVQPNVGNGIIPVRYTAFALLDSNNVRWVYTLLSQGQGGQSPEMDSEQLDSGPLGVYETLPFILRDRTGRCYLVSALTDGHLMTTPTTATDAAIQTLYVVDDVGQSWALGVDTTGHLTIE